MSERSRKNIAREDAAQEGTIVGKITMGGGGEMVLGNTVIAQGERLEINRYRCLVL